MDANIKENGPLTKQKQRLMNIITRRKEGTTIKQLCFENGDSLIKILVNP